MWEDVGNNKERRRELCWIDLYRDREETTGLPGWSKERRGDGGGSGEVGGEVIEGRENEGLSEEESFEQAAHRQCVPSSQLPTTILTHSQGHSTYSTRGQYSVIETSW